MMSLEQIIICILVVIIFYLYYLYKKALSANKEDSSINYFNTTGRPSGHITSPTNKKKEEEEEEKKENEEEDKEYTYEDPNFNLSPIIPSKTMSGKIVGEFGDAIYGNDKRYYKDLYYGRVSTGAKIELADKRVYKNQFELDIIKVRVIKNEWKDEEGRIGWVGLDDTSFRDQFDPRSRTITE